jgi:hypothetical protein
MVFVLGVAKGCLVSSEKLLKQTQMNSLRKKSHLRIIMPILTMAELGFPEVKVKGVDVHEEVEAVEVEDWET